MPQDFLTSPRPRRHDDRPARTAVLLATGFCLIAASLCSGCESDGGRMRQGIHDPIERHKRTSWTWPFPGSRKSKPAPVRAPQSEASPFEGQVIEGLDRGWSAEVDEGI